MTGLFYPIVTISYSFIFSRILWSVNGQKMVHHTILETVLENVSLSSQKFFLHFGSKVLTCNFIFSTCVCNFSLCNSHPSLCLPICLGSKYPLTVKRHLITLPRALCLTQITLISATCWCSDVGWLALWLVRWLIDYTLMIINLFDDLDDIMNDGF